MFAIWHGGVWFDTEDDHVITLLGDQPSSIGAIVVRGAIGTKNRDPNSARSYSFGIERLEVHQRNIT